ncbi:SMI1/KNR4 family protein [Candidatus Sororendozoicomonas aggregata]|uniref:SMI1/KNR4 family protein n=1 Tax=Candidatus Sororendozoicomonas aggregata TaxID=3073239 RepID=UPI002ED699E0
MEDTIELLREQAVDVPVPLSLPDEDDLVSIEEELLIPLPYDLRLFLLEVSNVVYGSLAPVTITDPHAHTHLPDVASVAWDLYVPRHLIPVCQDGDRYYCISEEGQISLWSAEGEAEETWRSLWLWVRDIWLNS